MAVVVHGVPGRSVSDARVGDRDSARRGAWFEKQVGAALERWLEARPETFHLFHDLCGFDRVVGAGLKPLSLGDSNIDHLVLTGNGWVMVDAKGCAAGVLRVSDGHGQVLKDDGTEVPQLWLDDAKSYARAGVPYRLTDGKAGVNVFVVPDSVKWDPDLVDEARAFSRSGAIVDVSGVRGGDLSLLFPPGQSPADDADVERLRKYLYRPDC